MKEIELNPVFMILNRSLKSSKIKSTQKKCRKSKIKLPQPENVYLMTRFLQKILEKNGKNFRI